MKERVVTAAAVMVALQTKNKIFAPRSSLPPNRTAMARSTDSIAGLRVRKGAEVMEGKEVLTWGSTNVTISPKDITGVFLWSRTSLNLYEHGCHD